MIPALALRAILAVGAVVVDLAGDALARGRARRAAKREDWLDQPLTPEETTTIRERLREPMAPLTDEPPRG